jgi:Pyridoxamine 5'-phosphate oxidase
MPTADSPRHKPPKASRPQMPGYGISGAESGSGLLPWKWAEERLRKSHNYWISTTRPDGRPHVMLVWGLWLNDLFYFSTGRTSRKARNLATNPNCVVCSEVAEEAVIVEGVVEEVADAGVIRKFVEDYDRKVDPKTGPIFAVRPRVAFGFWEADFTGSATRWYFEAD